MFRATSCSSSGGSNCIDTPSGMVTDGHLQRVTIPDAVSIQFETPDDEHDTLIHPTVTYASETWVLKESMINKLMIFERKIMRKILGPTRSDDGYWRIKINQEINDILKGQNIIGFIKNQD